MQNIKLFTIAAALVSLLVIANPAVTRAVNASEMPPAIVLVQDNNNEMAVKHNFEGDSRIWIPGKSDVDQGIWVTLPQ